MNETIILRANIMGGMNQDIIDLGDEAIYMKWIMVFPDGCEEDDLRTIAEDEELWLGAVKSFARCVKYCC